MDEHSSNDLVVIGAGGYVGTSLVEALVLDGHVSIRAVVRSYRHFARLCRFGPAVTIAVADAEDSASLQSVIAGASVVINLTTGSPSGIIGSTRAIFEACARANIRRLIHLSSAVVYGEVPSSAVTDDTPPPARHWMPYASAKATSEAWLREQVGKASLEVTVLRPGIVWGVRSPHTIDIVKLLLGKRAFLVDRGGGVFNGIYIDNLLACIRACCDHPSRVDGFFNVADAELVSWRDFFAALATDLDFDPQSLPRVAGDRFPWSKSAAVDYVQSLPLVNSLYHRLKAHVPPHLKSALRSRLAGPYEYDRFARSYAARPQVSREMWHLQKVQNKLPVTKFARQFNFSPPVSFDEGIAKTVSWLSFLGLTKSHSFSMEQPHMGRHP